MLGNPETSIITSHGRSVCRAVRTAPPLDSPLCCFSRLVGCGVDPIYSEAWRIVDRKT